MKEYGTLLRHIVGCIEKCSIQSGERLHGGDGRLCGRQRGRLLRSCANGDRTGASSPPIRTGQPPDPVPCLLLGQLATDSDWAGKGIGSGLLKHALHRCAAAARLIGGRALIVNAVDDEAAAFWARRGFLPANDDPLTLFRSIADIAASIGTAWHGRKRQDGRARTIGADVRDSPMCARFPLHARPVPEKGRGAAGEHGRRARRER
jgi:GNAT superfamily N-acetyltransferase